MESLELAQQHRVVVEPVEYSQAIRNPLKGFRGYVEGEYISLIKDYVKWNEIESAASDGVDRIREYSDRRWADFPRQNIKVIPRVYLEWPYQKDAPGRVRQEAFGNTYYVERYWPKDMVPGDYTSEQFRQRVARMIEKMAEAWDDDPRVAYIEMGLIGYWGEQHTPRPDERMQRLLGDTFTQCFRNKKVMVRYTQTLLFSEYDFGLYWDVWTSEMQWRHWDKMMIMTQPPYDKRWVTAVMGGERGGDVVDRSWKPYGLDLDVSADMAFTEYLDQTISTSRLAHTNHIGDFSKYASPSRADVAAGVAEVQKALGYRFVVDSVAYNPVIGPDNELIVSFSVRNTGSSPFYYNWPVEVSLLHPVTKQPVWREVFRQVDIRQWLPGDRWQPESNEYEVAPLTYKAEERFGVPSSLPEGEYVLALSILDPACNLPCVRFAMTNYYTGGRHPIGMVGVRTMISDHRLDPSTFDDMASDATLHYEL